MNGVAQLVHALFVRILFWEAYDIHRGENELEIPARRERERERERENERERERTREREREIRTRGNSTTCGIHATARTIEKGTAHARSNLRIRHL
jgi:hypothetical protein